MSTADAPELEQGLSTLVAPLLAWAAHFVFVYAVAAVFCAKGWPIGAMRAAAAAATLLALALLARWFVKGRARARREAGAADDAAHARRRFLGFATALTAGLSAVAIVYSALVFVLVRDCR